jgi:hypothetical protein
MKIIYKRVAGLDVHKKTVVAARMRVTGEDRVEWETKTFGTTTPVLAATLFDQPLAELNDQEFGATEKRPRRAS